MERKSCPNFRALMVANPPNTGNMLVARAGCDQWSCEVCSRKLQRMWRGYLNRRIAEIGGQWSFMTLTAHPAAHEHGWTLHNLRDAWKPVYDAIRYACRDQKPIEYIRLFEKHKTGEFHIHALWRVLLPFGDDSERWLKGIATAHGLGYKVDWRQTPEGTEAQKVAMYITKYMSKDAQGLMTMPKGLRRIQTSQGIGAMKPEGSEYVWRIKSGVYEPDVIEHNVVVDVSTGEVITPDYFKFHLIYPEEYDEIDTIERMGVNY